MNSKYRNRVFTITRQSVSRRIDTRPPLFNTEEKNLIYQILTRN